MTPTDPFASVLETTTARRAQHAGCGAYPYANGALLGALAAAANARRILELGTGLGYTALWLAHGAPDAVIDTIEREAKHVKLAREQISGFGLDGHIIVHQGDFIKVVPRLDPGYDLVFFDGFAPAPPLLAAVAKVLKTRGLLVSANLTHGGAEVDAYRRTILDAEDWLTAFVGSDGETAISVKL